MKLISMTDFVLQQQNESYSKDQFVERVEAYANFLKEPLKLEMFIPCDEDGKVLEEPKGYKYWIKDDENGAYNGDDESKCRQYQKTKEKVLFKGFDLSTAKYHCDRNDRTIEYFTSFEVELTPNASKKFEL